MKHSARLLNATTSLTQGEIKGVHFLVAVYDNGIEIQNPGLFLITLTLEEFKAGVSRIRNPTIARVFREARLIEEWGSGYERVQKECEALGCKKLPTWQEFGGGVMRVTFYPRPPVDLIPDLIPRRDQVGIKSLTLDWKKVLELTQQPCTLAELMNHFGLSHKPKFRQRYVNPLLEKGWLRMTIPEKPNSRLQKYVITQAGLQYLAEKTTDE